MSELQTRDLDERDPPTEVELVSRCIRRVDAFRIRNIRGRLQRGKAAGFS